MFVDKFDILDEVDKGVKKKKIANKYGIPSLLSNILKNRENIVKQVQEYSLIERMI